MAAFTVRKAFVPILALLLLLWGAVPAGAVVNSQCPGDLDGDSVPDLLALDYDPNVRCMHLGAGDGYITLGDGRPSYMFGFSDMTGFPDGQVMDRGMLAGAFPAPPIVLDEGNEFYLNLSNVGMMIRPDLFDPHTVHWHGFPEASSIFDGVPDASVSINMGSTLTYYYNVAEPGTYMYHCHVEATEHMQMGMLGNLYVRPAQNFGGWDLDGDTILETGPGGDDEATIAVLGGGTVPGAPRGYAYNDGDGSTAYDVEYPIQIASFDAAFHDASETVQPLPFALMRDDYGMLNGRGYPDTIDPGAMAAPPENGGKTSQFESSLVTARQGERILLRISNLNVTRFYTLASTIPMTVVGKDAKLHRGPSPDGGVTPGVNLYYTTNSVTLGGGESYDVIIDTAGLPTGNHFIYTTNLQYLSNGDEDFGGMMTELLIFP